MYEIKSLIPPTFSHFDQSYSALISTSSGALTYATVCPFYITSFAYLIYRIRNRMWWIIYSLKITLARMIGCTVDQYGSLDTHTRTQAYKYHIIVSQYGSKISGTLFWVHLCAFIYAIDISFHALSPFNNFGYTIYINNNPNISPDDLLFHTDARQT